MSLQLIAGEDFPRVFCMLDAFPFVDASGYERNPTVPTGPSWGPALVKGADKSLIVSNSKKISLSGPVLQKGKEYLPWSVEAFVRPVYTAATGPIQIFGNDGIYDGLVVDGNNVSFVTKYTSTGEARCSFNVMDVHNMGLVGVHTRDKNQLWVNGDLVSEVDITAAQQADTYLGAGTSLAMGASATANAFMVNAVSLYDTALDDSSILRHFANAQDTLSAEDVALAFRGALLEFGVDGAISPYFQIDYSSDAEWGLGIRNNVNIHDGTLYPNSVDNTSQSGYWETVIPLGNTPTTIYSANLLWEGVGATVTTSRDGIAWSPAVKGVALSTVTKGTNGEGQFLFVRVTFPGGVVNDPAFFDNMVFSLYSFGTAPVFGGREVALDKVSLEDDTDVIDLHENWGGEMTAGSIVIRSGTNVPAPKTVEVWVNKTPGGTFTTNLTADTTYSNGGTVATIADGQWQLRHYVATAGFTGDITFSGTAQVGHIILYPEALSADTIKEIYRCYTGKPKITLDVDEVFDIKEFAGKVDIYEYDWSIESAG